MAKLLFDIETIPSAEEYKESCIEILKKRKSNGSKADADIYTDTSFEGTFGRVCCVGIIKEGQSGISQREVLSGGEKEILTKFWQAAQGVEQ